MKQSTDLMSRRHRNWNDLMDSARDLNEDKLVDRNHLYSIHQVQQIPQRRLSVQRFGASFVSCEHCYMGTLL